MFTDAALFKAERELVFDRCWLYAGHESELTRPGDFVTRRVGGRPLLLTRGPDAKVRAFINACPHRGNLVAREPAGNARAFTCFYHAWTFDTKGALVGLPGGDAYAASFDRENMGLVEVPRLDDYRGLLFVCYDRDAMSLRDYLGAQAREQIDCMVDSAGGELEIVPGAQSYSMKANWKLLVENSIDSYHAMPTHQRFFRKYLSDIGVTTNAESMSTDDSAGRSLGNGHAVTEKPRHNTALSSTGASELAAVRSRVEAEHGAAYAVKACDTDRNLFIFPNLILISTWRTLRTFYPVSPDYMEIDAWGLMPKGESQELRALRFQNFISFLGPAGFGTPDDVTALEGCQQGYAAMKESGWNDISRGMHRPQPVATDEQQMRAFWRRWHAMLTQKPGETNCSDRSVRVEKEPVL